jgi:glyoxylase-like metal-dependent hydrolase (beta-lactamase superfamily II)
VGALTWWLSPHPAWEEGEDWPEEVPVVRYESEDGVVLIDPFLPPDGSFDPGGRPVHVLLTQGSHRRGADDFVARYGASVWSPLDREPGLPAGVEAIELDGQPQQVLFFIPEHATLVSGDALTGRDGVMHVFVDDADRERLLATLERVAELPVERVIVPHCEEPEFLDGAAHIRAAVAEARAAS